MILGASVLACDGGASTVAPTFESSNADPSSPAGDESDEDGPLILSKWTDGVVRGVVTLPAGGVQPPAGSTLMVYLWGSPEGEAKILLQHPVAVDGPAPWAFEFTYDQANFVETSSYSVATMLNDPEGNLWFASKNVQIWGIQQIDTALSIVLDPMDPRATTQP